MNLEKRWRDHNCGRGSKLVYRGIKKYGANNFICETLATYSSDTNVKLFEIAAIKQFNTKVPNGYNMTDGGDGALGHVHSEEAKRKMSKIRKGRILSEEHKQKIALARTGMKHSVETKAKISKIKKGILHPMFGKHPSEQSKQKMSVAKRGILNPTYGKPRIAEVKAKISAALRKNR